MLSLGTTLRCLPGITVQDWVFHANDLGFLKTFTNIFQICFKKSCSKQFRNMFKILFILFTSSSVLNFAIFKEYISKTAYIYLIIRLQPVKRPKGQAGSRGPSEERGTMNVNSILGLLRACVSHAKSVRFQNAQWRPPECVKTDR